MRVIEYKKGRLYLLDQRKLPGRQEYAEIKTSSAAASAIREMVVRGAPAIGITAAYACCVAVREKRFSGTEELTRHMKETFDILTDSRPTAVNLKWAVDKMQKKLLGVKKKSLTEIAEALEEEAESIKDAQTEADLKMGKFGAEELEKIKKKGLSVLTHCNAGALATGGEGTALGVIRAAHRNNILKMVYSSETRPRLQGARLTCWELSGEGIPCTLICDSLAAALMKSGDIDAVVTGADRIAANGDTANKTGTYTHALAAKYHGIPFYVAAPFSSFDFNTSCGEDIDIEYRDAGEVSEINGERIAPGGINVINAAFDITPADMISAYITERGIVKNVGQLQ